MDALDVADGTYNVNLTCWLAGDVMSLDLIGPWRFAALSIWVHYMQFGQSESVISASHAMDNQPDEIPFLKPCWCLLDAGAQVRLRRHTSKTLATVFQAHRKAWSQNRLIGCQQNLQSDRPVTFCEPHPVLSSAPNQASTLSGQCLWGVTKFQ